MEIWYGLKRSIESEKELQGLTDFSEIWMNDIYMVYVKKDFALVEESFPTTWLSIKRHDKEPCNDWRHFQFIKNQLVGEECEAVQLYPAESRLVDGSNQYHLWCVPSPNFRFPLGFNDGRTISEHPLPNGKQRAWPKNMRPKDMDEQNKLTNMKLKFNKEMVTKAVIENMKNSNKEDCIS